MKIYFHKEKVEEYVGHRAWRGYHFDGGGGIPFSISPAISQVGRTLSDKDGFNGQVRLARLQAPNSHQDSLESARFTSVTGATNDPAGAAADTRSKQRGHEVVHRRSCLAGIRCGRDCPHTSS